MWKCSDLETSDFFHLENWQFPPASWPPWMCCRPFPVLPTRDTILQEENFFALNEFANEPSSQHSEEMPSDTVGSAKREGNGFSVPTAINGPWFVTVLAPSLRSPRQGCARWGSRHGPEKNEVSEPISNIVSKRLRAKEMKQHVLGSSAFLGYFSFCLRGCVAANRRAEGV